MNRSTPATLALAMLLACAAGPAHAIGVTLPDSSSADADTTMIFTPEPGTTRAGGEDEPMHVRTQSAEEGTWLRAPYGDALITHPDPWRARVHHGGMYGDVSVNYDRVDLVRYGVTWQAQRPETMYPRLGTRLDYSTGRRRVLYGFQIEQPLLPTARFVFGVGAVRRTDHGDLQQVDDSENSLLLLLAHEDWRDHFEREGAGAYLSWRVPDFSTVSVHVRSDQYRSVEMSRHVVSWFREDRTLRPNPAIDDGETHSVLLRLERLAHRTRRNRSGLYHWIEIEKAGGPTLKGDFAYVRGLADVRSVVRVLPATTLALRAVGGTTMEGTLPAQRQFVIGGADGLRAHSFGSFRGDRVVLGQAEYSVGLQVFKARSRHRGPQVLAFVDTGTAWNRAERPAIEDQRFALDGGVGIATPDDDLRVTVAKDLQKADAGVAVAMRLQRPF